jgi:hypothetical protein
MARGLVRIESDSGFCIWWESSREREEEVAGMRRQSKAQVKPCPLYFILPTGFLGSLLVSHPYMTRLLTHLLQKDRELQAELLL